MTILIMAKQKNKNKEKKVNVEDKSKLFMREYLFKPVKLPTLKQEEQRMKEIRTAINKLKKLRGI